MIRNLLKVKIAINEISFKENIFANLPFRFYYSFSSSKSQLVEQLRGVKNEKSLSKIENYQKLISLIQFDLTSQSQPKYFYYSQIQRLYEAYVQEIVHHPSFKQYNPTQISLEGQRISKLFSLIAAYPKFSIRQQSLKYSYQIFYRFLNSRTEVQLNNALLFALKVDPKAEQSNIYGEFLTFYLEHRWERIKAKYQLNLRKQSIGQIGKKIISGFVHRGYLRRAPQYMRPLSILDGGMVLRLLLENPSTGDSLMIRKVLFKQVFMPIVDFYRTVMKNNLYHEKNTILWETLNQNFGVIFKENNLTEKQCQYLRQLYATLFLVLKQQNKEDQLIRNLSNLIVALQYIQCNYQSDKSKQFVSAAQDFCKIFTSQKCKDVSLNKNIFSLIVKFPEHSNFFMQIISKQLVPLTFKMYFNQLLSHIQYWNQSMMVRLTDQSQQSLLKYISFLQMIQILDALLKLSTKCDKLAIYKHLLKVTIQKEFSNQPTNEQVIQMLILYQRKRFIDESQEFKQDSQLAKRLGMLRVFLFRFISDVKDTLKKLQLQKISRILLSLDDSLPYGDGQGNYELNIYQELEEIVDKSFIPSQLKNEWKGKIGKKEENLNPLAGILKRLGQS